MVLKSSTVLSCLLPARFGFGSNQNESPNLEKRARDNLGDVPARANTPPIGDIGESPNPLHRSFAFPVRPKRSSFTTFFAFSSKRKPNHGVPTVHPQSVPGRWLSGKNGQTDVRLINTSAIPSPLLTDEEEYYYSYYTSITPSPASPLPDATHISPPEHLSLRQQDPVGNPDLDSHTQSQIQHPYAYSTPLHTRPHSKIINPTPSLRHATSQPFQHRPHLSRPDLSPAPARTGAPSSHIGHQVSQSQPHLSQPQLKTSISTPNLASRAPPLRARSAIRKLPPTKLKERWLSAETWWDALLSPSPRFKVKHAPRPRPHTANGRVTHDPVSTPLQGEPNGILGVTFPSLPAARPRAASATLNGRPIPPALRKSQSATNLGQPSTSAIPHAGFEPALETLVDDPTPMPDQVSDTNPELPLPEPPLSLDQVIDEGKALEEQRAQWKRQASRSIGNRHTRSFSRARSKSLSEKHAHNHSEGGKAHLNLEFLAARSLLGSQSTMPTVHVIKPSNSSSHSKAYSHSHSHSAYSFTHTCHSRVNSHSHSHSLTTSNSSKSSRNPRTHSRSGSWSRTALLKASSLCGAPQDDSCSVAGDEKIPSSSRVDVQGTIHISAEGASQASASKVSPPPILPVDEVGVAFSSTPPLEGPLDLVVSSHSSRHQGDQENRRSSKHTHRSSEYAGPHRSTIDSNLPRFDVASNVSMRHRLPPRPTIYPPITPIAHPYRSALSEPEKLGDKASQGATSKVTDGHVTSEPGTETTSQPHLSLSHSDFERYGVGEALVYASVPRPAMPSAAKQPDVVMHSAKLPPEEQSPSCETVDLQHEESDTASMAVNNSPSLTNSTIQMVMSAFNNPDDLDEFQDLFYKPHPISGDQHQESTIAVDQVPTDVRSSASSSPLTHLVRKLSEEVSGRRDPSQLPSDLIYLRSESQDHPSGESTTKFVFMDLDRSSSSFPPMGSSSQLHVSIQGEKESTTRPVMVIPEDVNSSYTASFMEGLSPERENDTFGHPIKHGQFGPATAPSPVRSPTRVSTHLSIQDEDQTDETTFHPVTKRYGMCADDVVRSSFLTTSVVSQMSGLFDFPLPPSSRPGEQSGQTSISHAYLESTPSEPESQSDDEAEMELEDGHSDDEEEGCPSGDVGETLQALRMSRAASFASLRTTFGGSEDMDFITQLHQACP